MLKCSNSIGEMGSSNLPSPLHFLNGKKIYYEGTKIVFFKKIYSKKAEYYLVKELIKEKRNNKKEYECYIQIAKINHVDEIKNYDIYISEINENADVYINKDYMKILNKIYKYNKSNKKNKTLKIINSDYQLNKADVITVKKLDKETFLYYKQLFSKINSYSIGEELLGFFINEKIFAVCSVTTTPFNLGKGNPLVYCLIAALYTKENLNRIANIILLSKEIKNVIYSRNRTKMRTFDYIISTKLGNHRSRVEKDYAELVKKEDNKQVFRYKSTNKTIQELITLYISGKEGDKINWKQLQ